jgi:hypothetical protein
MRVYAFFMPRAASMIFRLRLNEMDLQPSRQMLALKAVQRWQSAWTESDLPQCLTEVR